MSVSKIFMFTDEKLALEKFFSYRSMAGYNVLLIGPTDVFRIRGSSPDKIEWSSGTDRDWYMVILTEAGILIDGAGFSTAPPPV